MALLYRAGLHSTGFKIKATRPLVLRPGSVTRIITEYRIGLCRGYFGIIVPKHSVTLTGLEVKPGVVDWLSISFVLIVFLHKIEKILRKRETGAVYFFAIFLYFI